MSQLGLQFLKNSPRKIVGVTRTMINPSHQLWNVVLHRVGILRMPKVVRVANVHPVRMMKKSWTHLEKLSEIFVFQVLKLRFDDLVLGEELVYLWPVCHLWISPVLLWTRILAPERQ